MAKKTKKARISEITDIIKEVYEEYGFPNVRISNYITMSNGEERLYEINKEETKENIQSISVILEPKKEKVHIDFFFGCKNFGDRGSFSNCLAVIQWELKKKGYTQTEDDSIYIRSEEWQTFSYNS